MRAPPGPQLLDSDGRPVPCAWRFPGVGTAAAGALFLHRLLTVQSGGGRTRIGRLGAVERAAGPARGGGGDRLHGPRLLRLLRRVRLLPSGSPTPAGTRSTCPAAEAVHHDQLSTDLAAGLPRIVEFHRNRDLYMRKHHGPASAALAVRVLTAWSYALRAARRRFRSPGKPGRIYWAHARQASSRARREPQRPGRGRLTRVRQGRRERGVLRTRATEGRGMARSGPRVFVHTGDLEGLGERPLDRRLLPARGGDHPGQRDRVAKVAEPASLLVGEEAGGKQGHRVGEPDDDRGRTGRPRPRSAAAAPRSRPGRPR